MVGDLLSLLDVPHLDGASCRGLQDLYDRTIANGRGITLEIRQARETAQAICRQCPALAECRDWTNSLPRSKRPLGVTAGLVLGDFARRRTPRRRKTRRAA
ncbi:WhiB family transcriptional regulator [Mycobacterium sp. E2699]|uniref:WhiB family transcriptional regulator n=1 Tax=Mycobacterium sp. E2699 TaxID=1834137 RepID=UPI0009EECFEC|nr:WhiB family transcriptional regulator [Mycobacterium sp. E2699]